MVGVGRKTAAMTEKVAFLLRLRVGKHPRRPCQRVGGCSYSNLVAVVVLDTLTSYRQLDII